MDVYVTTEKAGPVVAGYRIPMMKDGKPQTGFELSLTPDQAEYELLAGTIAPKPTGKKESAKPQDKPQDKAQ